VFRFDRDTDGNGIFDEPPRTAPLSLVSAVDAGVVDVGVPVAGNDASWAPAVNEDGSQVAFVTDATNLLASHRAGGGGERDGDLLVAEVQLGQIRRVVDGSDDTDVPGAHGNPALSKTGEVIAFDTMATGSLTDVQRATSGGRRSVATVVVHPQLSLASLDFGTVLLGFESAELYARVLNAGPGAFEPSVVETSLPNFKVTGGTCTRGIIVAAGDSCSVNLTFNPTEQRGFTGTLTVRGYGANAPSATTTIHGAAGEPMLLAEPGGVDLDPGVVGDVGGRVAIDIANIGFFPTQVTGIEVSGAHAADFHVVTQSCTNRALNPDASCTIEVEFRPTGGGYRSALLIAAGPFGTGLSYTSAVLGGFATYAPSFDSNAEVVRPGSGVGVGGSGFPAGAPVSIGFDDGGAPFATITTNDDGAFLAVITVPGRLRAGPRNLVATAPGGVVATWPINILVNEVTATPHIPGYGLG
jgi:hypothetical protein